MGAVTVNIVQSEKNTQRLIFNGLAAKTEERFNQVIITTPGGSGAW